MKITLKALIAAGTMVLSMTSSTRAEISSNPKISIASLYGAWEDAAGREVYKYSIGPHWIAYFNQKCGYRYRYKVVQSEIITVSGEKSWEIGLDEWDVVEKYRPTRMSRSRITEKSICEHRRFGC
jgi:hypothetical protein